MKMRVSTVLSVFALSMLGSRAAHAEGAGLDNDVRAIGVPDEGEGGRFVASVLPGVPWGNSTPISDGHGSWISLAPDGSIDVSSSDHRLPKPEALSQRIVCKAQKTGRVVFQGERVGTAQSRQYHDAAQCGCIAIWSGVGLITGSALAAAVCGGAEALTLGGATPGCVYGVPAAGLAGTIVGSYVGNYYCPPSPKPYDVSGAQPAKGAADPGLSVDPASGWTTVIQTPAQPAPAPPVTTPVHTDLPALIHEPEADDGANSSSEDDGPVTCGPDDGEDSSSGDDSGGE
jgi:hypothetical protein